MKKNGTKRVVVIAIDGGGCSGKTLGIEYCARLLKKLGFRPFVVPEVATIVIRGGIYDMRRIVESEPEKFLRVQRCIARIQFDLEDSFLELAAAFGNEKVIIFCDRGGPSQIGFIGFANYAKILREMNLTPHEVFRRYDAVVHMVTAAHGAERFYGNKTNKARYEDAEWARRLDDRILEGWNTHGNLTVIDNSTCFRRKKERLFETVCGVLGIKVT